VRRRAPHRPYRAAGTLAALALTCALSGHARAQTESGDAADSEVRAVPVLPIVVERENGAEDCPDTDRLVSAVSAILGRGTETATPYQVIFRRGAQGFSAAIRADTDGAIVRRLHAREPSCASLAHAAAIALALLFDADLAGALYDATKPPEAVAAPEPTPARQPLVRTQPSAPPRRNGVPLGPLFSAGAGAVVGLVGPGAPALVADAGARLGRVRGSLGVLWAPPQTLELPPGSAREEWLGATLRACYLLLPGRVLQLGACSGAIAGAITAQARGFKVNERRSALSLAIPVELTVGLHAGSIGWELGASALVPCPPNEFQITGSGATYRPPPVAGSFVLRVVFEPR
jgi:hypothetical protein